jgi:hypothetical protein
VPPFARMVLLVGGTAMLVCGLAVAALGLVAGGWIRSQLPQVVINAAAVGGAAFTLGFVVAAAGGVQVLLALALPRAGRWAMAGAAVLAGVAASVLVALAVAAATELGRGGTRWLLAAVLGLGAAALAYGAGAWEFGRASTGARRGP